MDVSFFFPTFSVEAPTQRLFSNRAASRMGHWFATPTILTHGTKEAGIEIVANFISEGCSAADRSGKQHSLRDRVFIHSYLKSRISYFSFNRWHQLH